MKKRLFFSIISVILIASIIAFSIINGNNHTPSNDDEDSKFSVQDTSFKGFNFSQKTTNGENVTYNMLNMSTEYQLSQGVSGAGCQWPVGLAVSSDGSLMLYGTDVAGIFKSTDHGKTWQIANRGLHNNLACMFAIDPKNSSHAVCMSAVNYYSYDKAENWEMGEMPEGFNISGVRYLASGLTFDETSFNGTYCEDLYFSTPFLKDTSLRYSPTAFAEKKNNLSKENAGLYRSTDGGKSFQIFSNDIRLADGIVNITNDGRLFVGSPWGLFEVDKDTGEIYEYMQFSNQVLKDIDGEIQKDNYNNDGKASFMLYGKLREYENIYNVYMGVTGLDFVGNDIFVQTFLGIYKVSKDRTIKKITNDDTYPVNRWGQYFAISKSNPNHIVFSFRGYTLENPYSNEVIFSNDGGKTWKKSEGDNKTLFLQNNNWYGRERSFIIDPSNNNTIITLSSDTLFISENGGETFKQVSGISNMMVGGRFNYNYYDSDLLMFSAQDYKGAVSTDGGKTFKSINFTYDAEKYGNNAGGYGNMYGGFASDYKTYFGFVSKTWYGPYYLAITHDGGKNWTYYDGIDKSTITAKSTLGCSYYSCLQSYNDPNILYAENYISFNNGYDWQEMEGVLNVSSINPGGQHELYGTNEKGNLIVSYDDGRTWKILYDENWLVPFSSKQVIESEQIIDSAVDQVNGYVYVVVYTKIRNPNGQLIQNSYTYRFVLETGEKQTISYELDSTANSKNGFGYSFVRSIAIDPNCTDIIYLCAPAGYYQSMTSIIRSTDGGKTFHSLTSNNSEYFPSKTNNQGGYGAGSVRVLPNGRVLVACGCYGIYYFDPDYGLITQNSSPKHQILFVVGDSMFKTEEISNRREITLQYNFDEKEIQGWYFDKELTQKAPDSWLVTNSCILYAKV